MSIVTAQDVEKKRAAKTCTTPCTLELSRKWSYRVLFEKEGYEVLETFISPQLSGAGATGLAGNILIGGLIGVGVDASTGAMNDLKPNPLSVTLLAISEAVDDAKPEVAETASENAEDIAVEAVVETEETAEEVTETATDLAEEAMDDTASAVEDAAEAAVDAAEATADEAMDGPVELTPPSDS